ncbi:MAG: cation diffusion facilitator family transporter [Treponemataceae bacterium]|nr:cation diffusion facilitator family transporter [Treponemataceae bacterium]
MFSLLKRIFIKDFSNYTDPKVRTAYGILCAGFGIFLNVMLSVLKFLAGVMSKSVALTADAMNNLSDAASSIVTLLGFKLGAKKADKDHPFGHGRLEYVAGLIIAGIILIMGFELALSSIKGILNPEKTEFSFIPAVIMIASIAVKFYMYFYNHRTSKLISSPALDATAKDSLGDMISTAVAFASLVLGIWTDLPVDGIGGLIVSVFILNAGREAAQDTIDPLLGLPPEKEFVDGIEETVLAHEIVVGIHDLIVHDYGPGRRIISLHAEVPGNRNIFDIHDEIDVIEFELAQKFNCWATIHMDPIDTENQRLKELKALVVEICKSIDSRISAHDIRMVPGTTHTNLIFDIVRPLDCTYSEEELRSMIFEKVRETQPDVLCVITVDVPFV